jgi:hypothetical protein
LEAFQLKVIRYLDGLHTDAEARVLNEQLASSREYRDIFAALSIETGVLNELLLPATPAPEGADLSFERGDPEAFGRLAPSHSSAATKLMGAAKTWRVALAAVLLIAGMGAWLWQTHSHDDSQASLAPGMDVESEIFNTRLDSGNTSTFTLPKVGYVILEGPAEFKMLGPMRARLNSGRIKMRVTEASGRGFVVETPHGEIKDLGTEFGIDASQEADNGVVVFEGAVDLSIPTAKDASGAAQTERLVQGEGLTFNRRGRLSRIMSIVTGETATFEHGGDMRLQRWNPIIGNVTDNIIEPNVRKFYEIVPGGMREDALTYVDRPAHEWNGVDERGMPSYLIGADYVKTFNDDKIRQDVEISVTLCRPATLYVFLDVRVPPPDWLVGDFHDTGDKIGVDNGPFYAQRYKKFANYARGVGPGESIDEVCSVWKRIVPKPGIVKLGPNASETWESGMYAFAAAPLAEQGDDLTSEQDKRAENVAGAL